MILTKENARLVQVDEGWRLVKLQSVPGTNYQQIVYLTGPLARCQSVARHDELAELPDWLVGMEITVDTKGLLALSEEINRFMKSDK